MEQDDLGQDRAGMWSRGLPVIDVFTYMIVKRVPDRFPGLRVGFMETGSSRIRYEFDELWARKIRQAWHVTIHRAAF